MPMEILLRRGPDGRCGETLLTPVYHREGPPKTGRNWTGSNKHGFVGSVRIPLRSQGYYVIFSASSIQTVFLRSTCSSEKIHFGVSPTMAMFVISFTTIP